LSKKRHIRRAIETIDLIADRWTLMIVFFLREGRVLRFGELQKEVGSISSKVLTQTLRRMERDGIVHREAYPVIPPKVEYSLTSLGESLAEPIITLCEWSNDNYDKVESARQAYDETNSHSTS